MATINSIINGLEIMADYDVNQGESHIGGADHDIIWGANTPPENMNGYDVDELDKLGWFWSEEYECWSHYA